MRVLLVGDDEQTATNVKMMLLNENVICDTTDLGEIGLEIGKIYQYDIILLDLMLPDIEGYEVLRRMRAARVRTPILILSGRLVWLGAGMLGVFTALAAFTANAFWTMQGQERFAATKPAG